MAAPFIKALQVQGGTLYTFSSSSEDLTLSFNNDATKFRFSKYVLLNVPNIKTPTSGENFIQFNAIDGAFGQLKSSDSLNLSESFQNYVLNLESLITSEDSYDRDIKLNVSERVFWKWIKELGGIRYRAANTTEKADGTVGKFIEEDEKNSSSDTIKYNKVVKYLGDIDVINSVKNNKNAYSEIYIHIPNKDGNTPFVLFNSIEDDNYGAARTYTNKPEDPINADVLVGRDEDDTHPTGLSIQAFYDQDVIGGMAAGNANTKVNGVNGNWYDLIGNTSNSYFTDATFGDATTDDIIKTDGTLTTTYKRSRLDGVTVDFNELNYKPIVTTQGLSTISDWNASSDSGSFEFNTVLIYYDVYNTSDPNDSATNLYGVLFLDDTDPISGGGSKLKAYQKFKPNAITKLNGNSYGFKLNLKFDVSADNVGVEKSINDFSSFSMDIFTDASTILQEATRALTDQNLEIINLANSVNELKDLILSDSDKNEILDRLETLEDLVSTSKNIFADNASLISLINRNYDEILNIYKNNTSLNIAYNLDVIKPGAGMFINRNTTNQIIIENTQQEYNLSVNSLTTLSASVDNVYVLLPYTNYLRHENATDSLNVNANIVIKIDDASNRWKIGQSFKLSIKDPIFLTNYAIIILTDSTDRLKTGDDYNANVAQLSSLDLNENGTGLFEIICTDDKALTFVVDKIN